MSLRPTQHEALVAGGIAARRIACVNDSSAAVPVYSIVSASGGVMKPHANSPYEYLKIDYPTGSNDALFVTMGKALTASSPGIYGHAWSVLSGPLWINYSGTEPSEGDIVGPEADSFTVSTDGIGFKVLQVDTTNERVRAVFLGGGGGGDWLVEIDSMVVNCGCKVATCTVLRTPCGNRKYAVGDEVTVFDDLGCILNVTDPAAYVGVRAWVVETEGDINNPYAVSPLPEDCDPDDNPYTVLDYEACHLSFVTRCCLNE